MCGGIQAYMVPRKFVVLESLYKLRVLSPVIAYFIAEAARDTVYTISHTATSF